MCEECDIWFHVDCVNITETMLSSLARSDIPWECNNCGLPNISATLFDSISTDSMSDSTTSYRSSTGSYSSSKPGSPCA